MLLRTNKPLTWWRNVLPESLPRLLERLWPYTLKTAPLSFLFGFFIAITGFAPGVGESNPDPFLTVCRVLVFGAGSGVLLLTFAAGFAHGAQRT